MIQSLLEKHAPRILTIIALAILMYSDIQNLKVFADDYKARARKTHSEHSSDIKKLKKSVIILENTCVTKDQYYNDKEKILNANP